MQFVFEKSELKAEQRVNTVSPQKRERKIRLKASQVLPAQFERQAIADKCGGGKAANIKVC